MICRKCSKPVSILDPRCPHCGNDLAKVETGGSSRLLEQRYVDLKTFWLGTDNNETVGEASFKDAGARDVEVTVDHWDKLNWSLINYGIPLINRIVIANKSRSTIDNILIKLELLPDYGESWQESVPTIHPRESFIAEKINLPLSYDRLLGVREAERASLKTEITANGTPLFFKTTPLEVLAYNEWHFHPLIFDNLAGFILPNCEAVAESIKLAGEYLFRLTGVASFDGYQSKDGGKVAAMAHALFLALQRELKIKYINPPASFEKSGQKIRFPEEIVNLGRGTCLDLALFYAACLEAVGLFPLVFLVPRHALLGVWLSDRAHVEFWGNEQKIMERLKRVPVRSEREAAERYLYYLSERCVRVRKVVEAGLVLPINSTTFTEESDFRKCVEDGEMICRKTEFDAVIDVRAARCLVKPMKVKRSNQN